MQRPVAFKVLPRNEAKVLRVRVEPLDVSSISVSGTAPAVLVSRGATMLSDLTTGIIDAENIITVNDGDWANAILVVLADESITPTARAKKNLDITDTKFIQMANSFPSSLANLCHTTIKLIRSAGVDGQLVENTKGRWVNSPTNSFTIKIQPRKKNIQFTLYGNPPTYQHDGFLRKDQNSYSRGWVNNPRDAEKLAILVAEAHSRKTK